MLPNSRVHVRVHCSGARNDRASRLCEMRGTHALCREDRGRVARIPHNACDSARDGSGAPLHARRRSLSLRNERRRRGQEDSERHARQELEAADARRLHWRKQESADGAGGDGCSDALDGRPACARRRGRRHELVLVAFHAHLLAVRHGMLGLGNAATVRAQQHKNNLGPRGQGRPGTKRTGVASSERGTSGAPHARPASRPQPSDAGLAARVGRRRLH